MSSNKASKQEIFTTKIISKLNESRDIITKQWAHPIDTSTRHFFLDNLLSKVDIDEIYNAFPKNGDGFFDKESFREKKRTSADLSEFNPILSDITYAIQDQRVVNLVSDICNMEMIDPDPKLYAGGLSMMFPNDYLNPHIDNSHDGVRNKYRRLNLLYYVSPNWDLEYGGNFELWNDDRTEPHTIIAHQNRLVVMETNKYSWHSVSKVMTDRPRCCVSNYYFSEKSPHGDDYFHVTSFQGRPEQPIRSYIGVIDNALRNFFSKTLKIGRGKNLINKNK
jgi:Rps23 Pro-64 3,4-dihydroxylase Tpa1-like proline 4-hydroxylase